MPVYSSDQQFYNCLERLFTQIGEVDPQAADQITKSKLTIRFNCTEPDAEVLIDGRSQPLQIQYGSTSVKPVLDIMLTGDTLHEILLGTLKLSKAVGSKRLKPKGPIWKATALEPILHHAQTLYPQIIADCGAAATN